MDSEGPHSGDSNEFAFSPSLHLPLRSHLHVACLSRYRVRYRDNVIPWNGQLEQWENTHRMGEIRVKPVIYSRKEESALPVDMAGWAMRLTMSC